MYEPWFSNRTLLYFYSQFYCPQKRIKFFWKINLALVTYYKVSPSPNVFFFHFPKDISCKDSNLIGFHVQFFFLNLIQYAFIIFAAVCASLYFLFLCVMVFRVFWNIRGKKAAIPTMSRARQLQYQVRETLLREFTRVDGVDESCRYWSL